MLRDVCDTYSKVDRDLVDIMWEDHGFKVEPKHSGYELLKRFELYQSGLELLGEINSDVGFLIFIIVTPALYVVLYGFCFVCGESECSLRF